MRVFLVKILNTLVQTQGPLSPSEEAIRLLNQEWQLPIPEEHWQEAVKRRKEEMKRKQGESTVSGSAKKKKKQSQTTETGVDTIDGDYADHDNDNEEEDDEDDGRAIPKRRRGNTTVKPSTPRSEGLKDGKNRPSR